MCGEDRQKQHPLAFVLSLAQNFKKFIVTKLLNAANHIS
jgi:hypothetical protein